MPRKRTRPADLDDFLASEESDDDSTSASSSPALTDGDSDDDEPSASGGSNVKEHPATKPSTRRSRRTVSTRTQAAHDEKAAAIQRLVTAKQAGSGLKTAGGVEGANARRARRNARTTQTLPTSSSEEIQKASCSAASPPPSPPRKRMQPQNPAITRVAPRGRSQQRSTPRKLRPTSDTSSSEEVEAKSSPEPVRRRGVTVKRSGPRPSNMMTGYLDYKEEEEEEDDLADFVVDREESESEEDEMIDDDEGQAQPNSITSSPASSLKGDQEDEVVPATKRQRQGGKRVGQLPGHTSSSSSSSGSDPENWVRKTPTAAGGMSSAAREQQRNGKSSAERTRLRKAAGARLDTSEHGFNDKDDVVDLTGDVHLEKQPVSAGKALPIRAVRLAPQLTAAQRINLAQQEWQAAQDRGRIVEGEDGEARILTDEGEPTSTSSSSGASLPDEPILPIKRFPPSDPRKPSKPTPAPAAGKGRGKPRDAGWHAAAEALGIGQPTEREAFAIYIELLLLCYVDPSYKDQVKGSQPHSQHYSRAVRQIEWAVTHARDAVASDAWRSSAKGLVEAVEALPGWESEWVTGGGEEWDAIVCDACNRSRSHATRMITFKGVPCSDPNLQWADPAANRHLGDALERVSPAYQNRRERRTPGDASGEMGWWDLQTELFREHAAQPRTAQHEHEHESDGESGEGEEESEDAAVPGQYRREQFRVGRYCAARLALFHGLCHWKRRLMARLKAELKRELRLRKRLGESLDPGLVADALLSKESLLAALFDSYKRILELAEKYQVEEGGRGWKVDMDGMQAEVVAALAELHDDSEGEESSVAWPEDGAESDDDSDEEHGPAAAVEATPPPEQQQQQQQKQHTSQGMSNARRRTLLMNTSSDEEERKQPQPQQRETVAAGVGPSPPRSQNRPPGAPKQVDIRRFFSSPGSGSKSSRRS